MRLKHIVVLLSFVTSLCFAQTAELVKSSDTLNCNELIRLADKHRVSNPYASAYYAEKAIRLGLRKNQIEPVVKANLLLGRLLEERNNTADAYKYYQRAIQFAADIKDTSLLSQCYQSIAVIYKRLELFSKSIEYLSKSLKFSEQSKNYSQQINCKNVMGHVYMDWFDKTKNKTYFSSSIKSYEAALDLSREHNNDRMISNCYASLANAWMLRFKNFNESFDIKKSIAYSYEGLNFGINANHPEWTPIHYMNIGEANYYSGHNDSAIFYYEKTLALHKRFNNQDWFEPVHRDMALAYKAKGEPAKAIGFIRDAIEDGMKYHASAAADDYRILSELYSMQKDYINAFDAYKRYKQVENMDINSKRTLQLERLQIEYESNLKDREIEYLNQKKKTVEEKLSKNRLFILLIVISLTLAIFICVFLVIHSRNLRRSKELSDSARIMQEQFLANTSHEIRTPMNGIQGMVNLLLDSPLNSTQRQQLETIKTSSNHLLRIINDLLDLSKIKAGKIEFVKNNFEVTTIVNLIRELMLPLAENKELKLNFKIESSAEGYFKGDDIRLEQILINLISNAVKYTEKGEVKLLVNGERISQTERMLCFKITDSGIGIPRKKLGVIFDSFVQLENAGRRRQGGAGLGLSITKQLVELQKGTIAVNSSLGEGSEFTFSIPYEISDQDRVNTQGKEASIQRDLKGKRILVVEDNEINQKVILNTLKLWNADVSIVSSAVEGFDLLIGSNFDLILMDIELPVINGWDATQYIRLKFEIPKRNIPVIALTAYASEDDKNKCFSAGMNDIVTKPFNSDELYVKIYSLIFNQEAKLSNPLRKTVAVNHNQFSELENKYCDNREGLTELYNLFLTELPLYLNELKALNDINNTDGVKKQAHKMKSALGLVAGEHLMRSLNKLQEKEILDDPKERKMFVDDLIRETEKVREEVSRRLEEIENQPGIS